MLKNVSRNAFFINTISEIVLNMLKRLDYQKDAVNHNRISFFDIDN